MISPLCLSDLGSPGQRSGLSANQSRGMTAGLPDGTTSPATPLSGANASWLRSLEFQTGGFASPSRNGYALVSMSLGRMPTQCARCLSRPTRVSTVRRDAALGVGCLNDRGRSPASAAERVEACCYGVAFWASCPSLYRPGTSVQPSNIRRRLPAAPPRRCGRMTSSAAEIRVPLQRTILTR